ncbi:unnamed protein product [Blepharisma stoltei]|uniref:Uncharacterized protein n=1 Tax=Blepharisma stoltei TaxID=1481888 RepID=A0AAU9I995_9CILI|nr:unnamed protein product [Blepharisma stoltei]
MTWALKLPKPTYALIKVLDIYISIVKLLNRLGTDIAIVNFTSIHDATRSELNAVLLLMELIFAMANKFIMIGGLSKCIELIGDLSNKPFNFKDIN